MADSSPIRRACDERLAEELAAIDSHRASGGRVAAFTCHAFPASVTAGLGLWPIRLICGATPEAENIGEGLVRPDICPLVKTMLGNASLGRGLHGKVDIWIGLATCDQMRRGLHRLSEVTGREVFSIHLPATRTVEAEEFYVSEVRRIVQDLESRYGLSFDPDKARVWEEERRAAAALLSRIAWAGDVSPLDLHAMFHLFFISRPSGLAAFFEGILASAEPYRAGKTIVLTGSPVAMEDTVLIEDLEARGIGLLPLGCTGLNAVDFSPFPPLAESSDTPGMLARSAFRLPACARARPNHEVYERIGHAIEKTGAAGLIVKCLTFCDSWYTERERLRKSFSLPVLVFDSDYATGGRERLLSRIDAFVETMEGV